MAKIYGGISLTGGTTGALDYIDGTDLLFGDAAIVVTSSGMVYVYTLSTSTGAVEDSPNIIIPVS